MYNIFSSHVCSRGNFFHGVSVCVSLSLCVSVLAIIFEAVNTETSFLPPTYAVEMFSSCLYVCLSVCMCVSVQAVTFE